MGEELELLNRQYKLNFFKAKKLRLHDDTIDGYIVHALSFGWFDRFGNLSPILALSEDPFDTIFDRVQQYQTYLAYAQNPLNDPNDAPIQIAYELQPGTLYTFNRQDNELRTVSFQSAKIFKKNNNLGIQHTHSEIAKLSLETKNLQSIV